MAPKLFYGRDSSNKTDYRIRIIANAEQSDDSELSDENEEDEMIVDDDNIQDIEENITAIDDNEREVEDENDFCDEEVHKENRTPNKKIKQQIVWKTCVRRARLIPPWKDRLPDPEPELGKPIFIFVNLLTQIFCKISSNKVICMPYNKIRKNLFN